MHGLIGLMAAAAGMLQGVIFDSTMRGFTLGGEASGYYFAQPSGQAVADLDGDGDLDVAYANGGGFVANDPVLGVAMNRGDGSFADPVLYAGPVGPTSAVTAADLDADGDMDLALTRGFLTSGENVLIFLNDGNGGFASAGVFPCGRAPHDIVAADFDGDGDTDLATPASTNQLSNDRIVTVLFNDGAADFSTRLDLPTQDIPYWIAAGDLNLDGVADIVYTYRNWNDFGVLLSDGAGGFHPFVRYRAPGLMQTPNGVSIGDLDEDGLPDVVFGEYKEFGFPGAVGFFRNVGGGQLDAGRPVATVLERHPTQVRVADVDLDGHLDIAFIANDIVDDGWGYLPGRGDGAFDTARYFTVGDVPVAINIADATGDGLPDALLTVDHALVSGSGSLNVHAQNADGGFSLPPKVRVDGRTQRLDVADIDLDGDLDVVTAFSTAFISLLNNGDGTFTTIREPRQLSCMRAIRLNDLNGDGFPDLILTKHPDCPGYDLYTAINDGDGTFGALSIWPLASAGDNEQVALDYDNDGDLDIAATESLGTPGGGRALLFLLDNNGDGTFAPVRRLPPPNHEGARRIEAADINADGNLDIIGSSAGDGVIVMLGDGAGSFPSIERYANAPQLHHAAVSWVMPADMNGDGHLDVAYAGSVCFPIGFGSTCLPAAGVMIGDGSGALVDGGFQLGPHGSTIEMFGADVVDFDGDGNLDLLSSAQTNAEVVVFRGIGDGSLMPGERLGLDTSTYQPHAGDFGGDGRPDAVVVGWKMEGVYVSLLRNITAGTQRGDTNCDGVIDSFDVEPFVLALTDPKAYASRFANCNIRSADANGDGAVDSFDIEPFVKLLLGP